METTTKKVVQGAFLLTIAGLISKFLSAIYRIPLQNLTGDLGFYIYQQIYPLIGMVMILSLYGFPVAISQLTVETIGKKRSLTISHFYLPLFLILLLINGILFIAIFLLAPHIADWIGDSNLKIAFQQVACLFLLIPFLALLRGIFQGLEEMKYTAYSQITEQVVRVTIIVGVAYFIYDQKLNVYSIGEAGVIATMAGMVISTVLLIFCMNRIMNRTTAQKVEKIPWGYYFRFCFLLGIVASLNHMILILMQLADVLSLVPSLLNYGFSSQQAMETKGIFDRGQPLIQFGVVFGSSFALALVPAVTRKHLADQKEKVYDSIRSAIVLSFYIASGATIGLILVLPETNMLLFMNKNGTGSLQILALSILLTSIAITGSTILQIVGYIGSSAIWIITAFFIKWMLNIILVPYLGIHGSALATVSSLALLCVMVVITLRKKLPGLSLFDRVRWKPFVVASIGMAGYLSVIKFVVTSFIDFTRLSLLLYVPFLVLSGAFIYVVFLLRYQALTAKQLQTLPLSQTLLHMQKIVEK